MFVHGERTDDSFRQVMVIVVEIEEELVHGAAGTGGGAEDEDFVGTLEGFGDGFVEALEFRLSFAVGVVLVVVEGAAEAVGIIGRETLRQFAMQFRFVDAGFTVIDDDQQM